MRVITADEIDRALTYPALIEAFQKIRDSYNVNGLGQIAAMATLDELPYYRKNFQKIVATRRRLSPMLAELAQQAGRQNLHPTALRNLTT